MRVVNSKQVSKCILCPSFEFQKGLAFAGSGMANANTSESGCHGIAFRKIPIQKEDTSSKGLIFSVTMGSESPKTREKLNPDPQSKFTSTVVNACLTWPGLHKPWKQQKNRTLASSWKLKPKNQTREHLCNFRCSLGILIADLCPRSPALRRKSAVLSGIMYCVDHKTRIGVQQ